MGNIFMNQIEGDNDIILIKPMVAYKGMAFTDNSLISETGKLSDKAQDLMNAKLLRFLFVFPTSIIYSKTLTSSSDTSNASATLGIRSWNGNTINTLVQYTTGSAGNTPNRTFQANFSMSTYKKYITTPWTRDLTFDLNFTNISSSVDMYNGANVTYSGKLYYDGYYFAMIPEYGFFG